MSNDEPAFSASLAPKCFSSTHKTHFIRSQASPLLPDPPTHYGETHSKLLEETLPLSSSHCLTSNYEAPRRDREVRRAARHRGRGSPTGAGSPRTACHARGHDVVGKRSSEGAHARSRWRAGIGGYKTKLSLSRQRQPPRGCPGNRRRRHV